MGAGAGFGIIPSVRNGIQVVEMKHVAGMGRSFKCNAMHSRVFCVVVSSRILNHKLLEGRVGLVWFCLLTSLVS